VEVLGRQCLELDGTRPFHRTCPYGGDVHWHDVYWGQRPLLDYRKVATGRLKGWSPGIGGNLPDGPTGFTEFGLCSPANHETWRRILPPDEWQDWPPRRDAIFIHHTPTFEYTHVDKMTLYARDFLEPGNFPDLIKGMQLSQGLGMKLLIESMRIRKPQTTTTYFYKLTENYPSCSWATLDYYGVPKRSHYDVREAYAPVHVMALFEDWSSADDHLGLSVHAANDTAAPVEAALTIRLFDGQLNVVEADTLDVAIPVDRAIQVADKTYALPPNTERPLFLCLDLTGEQGLIDRNWYYFDFADRRGTLLERPQTTLAAEIREENDAPWVTIQNTGDRPALSVELNPGEASNTYYADQGGLWLDPGERITVALRRTAAVDGDTRELKNLWLSAWNVVPRDLLRREEG
jgi:beta-mannosidase